MILDEWKRITQGEIRERINEMPWRYQERLERGKVDVYAANYGSMVVESRESVQ